ncbi:MAG: cupin-like domain-containing protein [Erythrobacter sp.]
MTGASAAEAVGAPMADSRLDIPRMSVADEAATRKYFEGGPAHPVIYTDALDDWPAWKKWSIDWFEREYGDEFGLIPKDFFDGESGKAVTLGDYIKHLNGTSADTPGFWVDEDKVPVDQPLGDPAENWAFGWRPFHDCPDLLDDLGPYPAGCENLVQRLPNDVEQMFEWITGRDFFSIYISRKGTVTPMHYDFHHSVGSLAQFEGTKHVILAEPRDEDTDELRGLNPEDASYALNEHAAGRLHYYGQLEPGDLLIIPPRWWHSVRSENHTLTLSHNFFSPQNIGEFLRGAFGNLGATDREILQAKLGKSFPQKAGKTDR